MLHYNLDEWKQRDRGGVGGVGGRDGVWQGCSRVGEGGRGWADLYAAP